MQFLEALMTKSAENVSIRTMVSLVLVSHSQKLADSVADLALLMAKTTTIKAVGGNDDGDYGSSFSKIKNAIDEVYSEDGVIVIGDIGSSINAIKEVIKSYSPYQQENIILADCPMIEGALAAAVIASVGMPLCEVLRQAEDAKSLKKV